MKVICLFLAEFSPISSVLIFALQTRQKCCFFFQCNTKTLETFSTSFSQFSYFLNMYSYEIFQLTFLLGFNSAPLAHQF